MQPTITSKTITGHLAPSVIASLNVAGALAFANGIFDDNDGFAVEPLRAVAFRDILRRHLIQEGTEAYNEARFHFQASYMEAEGMQRSRPNQVAPNQSQLTLKLA